jgi:iron complex transport system ATP-binding protein
MTKSSRAIQALNIHVLLNGQEVLHGVDLEIRAGYWTSIVGPNGAGKSTLLKVLAGLLEFQGEVLFFDAPSNNLKAKERAQQISWLGQNEVASDDLNVWDVVMLGRLPYQDWMAAPSSQDIQAVETALQATQAWDWRQRRLGQLSAGEKQRVLLARAIAVQSPLMLMDEPLTNLDPPHQVNWLEQVRCLTSQGKTVVSVLHEVGMALHADDMVLMQAGRIVHQGACSDPTTHRAIETVFDNRIAIQSILSHWVAVPNMLRST